MRQTAEGGRTRFLILGWRYLREFRWLCLLSVVLVLAASIFELAGVALVIPLLEEMGSQAGTSSVSRYARAIVEAIGLDGNFLGILVLFAGLTLVKFALTEWAGYSGRVLSASLRYRLRQRIFNNLMALPLSFYYTRRSGDIISSTDTSTTEASALVENLIRLLNVIVFAAVYLLVQLMVSAWMTLAVLAFTVLSYYLVSPRFAKSFTQGEHAKRMFDATVSFLQDRLAGIKTIKAFGNEARHRMEFDRLGIELRALAISMQWNKIVAHAFGEPLTTVAVVGMLVLAVQVLHLSIVELLTFFYAYSLLVPRMKAVTTESLTILEKLPHFEKVYELIEPQGKQYLPSGPTEFAGLTSDIELRHVAFDYGGSPASPVLVDVSFVIGRLRTTALVGASGVGKTTIGDLVLRLHDPTGGMILVNGRDLREYSAESWHRRVAFVEQEPFLFHDTVVNNIRYGRPDASDDEVRRAASLAHADGFIQSLPAGFDTVVGQRGMALSGGQRQRIALARALIRRPDVLVLDEATSALDSEAERLVREAIEELRRECTLLVIAHRLSTITTADQIVVVEGGRVAESGTHHELLPRGGLYARYYALQTETAAAR